MTPEQIHGLLEAYRDGTLETADARRLAAAIEAGDETSRLIMDEIEFSGLLSTALEDFDSEDFVRSLEEKFHAQESASVFTEKFQERVRGANLDTSGPLRKKPVARTTLKSNRDLRGSFARQYLRESSGTNWAFRTVAALAASLVIIAGGYWLLNRSGHGRWQEYVSSPGAIAFIQSAEGSVEITRAGKTVYAGAGAQILAQDVVVASSNGRAEIKYGSEETVVKLLPGSTTKFWLQDDAKRVRLENGTLVSKIAKQPEGRAMRFITPQAEAMVVGTQLKLAVSNDATHLEVTEGKVKLARNDQQFVMVGSGESADVAEGVELKVQPLKPAPAPTSTVANTNGQMPNQTSYYAQWSNGIPSDPSFFPIWAWDQNTTNAKAYKDAGINLYIEPADMNEYDLSILAAAGMKVICGQEATALARVNDKTIVGWISCDQPDIEHARSGFNYLRGPAVEPSVISQRYNTFKSKDTSRPVFLTLSKGVVYDDYLLRGKRMKHPEDYQEFVKGADIIGLHAFTVETNDQLTVGESIADIARCVDNLYARFGNTKPVWCLIKCTKIHEDSVTPTPAQVRSEVWTALVHGARGFGYFCHSLDPSYEMAALLQDKGMLAAVSDIDHQVASLAPVLNSPTVSDGATVISNNTAVPIDLMVKKYGGTTYIFAVAAREGVTTATFTIPSGTKAEVLGENRSLDVSGGKFSDRFESYGVHLYKVSAPPQTASK